MNRTFLAAMLLTGVTVAVPDPAAAQSRPPVQPRPAAAPAAPVSFPVDEQNARDTQQRLQELLRNYPPTLRRVLQLDPALLSNEAYVGEYPALAAFIGQHPDILHHAAYYLGQPDPQNQEDPKSRAMRALVDITSYVTFVVGFIAFFVTISWLARLLVDHRRWLRTAKIQTDVQAKVFDRLTSNDDLLAYIHSPAGSRFLQPAPMSMDAGARSIGAPVSRILWSVQAGVVLAVVGVGLWFARRSVMDELVGPLNVIAVLAISLGLGFAISAAVAFGLSQRLGLLEPPKP